MDTHQHDGADLLSIVNHPPSCLPGESLLHRLVRDKSTDGSAIEHINADGSQACLTYKELHDASSTVAARIASAAPEAYRDKQLIVPVLIPQSPALYIALLGILKAGGAFCPLSLDIPAQRAEFILNDLDAAVVLTTPELAPVLAAQETKRIILLLDPEDLSAGDVPAFNIRQAQADDLAYVMYTSGSTGQPKGVGVSHMAATQSLLAHDRHIPPFSRFLQFAAPTFDVSVFEIFFPLFRGKTLVSADRARMLNDLPAVIRCMDVDACELTPTVAGSLLRKRAHVPGLKALLTIGEMLTEPVIREFGGDETRPTMLWAMYGPTEAAIHCTLQPEAPSNMTVRSIGVPLDSTSAFVLRIPDGDSPYVPDVLPRGEIGELAIGGHQLARGYINRHEQTANAFIDTPYGRLYRTGDRALMHQEGTLECLGRISDGQVKLRGQRIELGEVEHAAVQADECHAAVAAVIDKMLVLFCASDSESDVAKAAILQACKLWLPGFMVPGDIVVVKDLPRMPSGKVDRRMLSEEYTARKLDGREEDLGSSGGDEVEQRLCELAQHCLGNPVTPSTDLLLTGLDSIAAIIFTSALQKNGFSITAADVLGSRTVSALRARVREQPALQSPPDNGYSHEADVETLIAENSILRESSRTVKQAILCTPLQTSMLSETMHNPRAYCNWVELCFPGTHTAETVASWFQRLVQRHSVLRIGFFHWRGGFWQVVFQDLDSSDIIISSRATEDFQILTEADFLRPLRIQISEEIKDRGRYVILQIHHAIYDGWSMDIIKSELSAMAEGLELPERPQFDQIAVYHISPSFKNACSEAKEYWADTLAGLEPASLPLLTPELIPDAPTHSTTFEVSIEPKVLTKTMRDLDCSVQVLFQATLMWMWRYIAGNEDVVIGSVTSGRTIPVPGIDSIVGPCIAVVPLRIRLSAAQKIQDLLRATHEANRQALPHAVLPLADIKKAAGVRAGQALYNVLFVYQESAITRAEKGAGVVELRHQDFLETKLLVEVEPVGSHFSCTVTYHTGTFPDSYVDLLVQQFAHLAGRVMDNLQTDVSSLERVLPTPLLSIYNPQPETFEGIPDLALAVEDVANKYPSRAALMFASALPTQGGHIEAQTLSFWELDRMANSIAFSLQGRGVKEQEIVVIALDKSVLLYATILAVLKLGCVYLPLLPTTPPERFATILRDSNASLCVCEANMSSAVRQLSSVPFVNARDLDLTLSPEHPIRPTSNLSRLAYVIYTSGSTGVPKGVCITQLNILSNLSVLSKIYPTSPDARLLQSCSQAFDVSAFEIFFAWTNGICLCAAPNDALFQDLEKAIRDMGVTHLSMTPTVAAMVDPAKVPDVQFLVTAGEPMTQHVADSWGERLYQGYGPSETTNICTVKRMGALQVIQHLGWSFRNTSTVVLFQDSLQVAPVGFVGEFCFGGDQVAQGYLNNAELTSSKFIQHPEFGSLYRSGDLGRMLPDGSLMIIGRVDDQVKLRGLRIELGEITAVIKSVPDVEECLSLLIQDKNGAGQLVSFVVPKGHTKAADFDVLSLTDEMHLLRKEIFSSASATLSDYMVPSHLVAISSLPITSSGKVDKKRLIGAFHGLDQEYLMATSNTVESEEQEDEWTETELRIAQIVASVLDTGKLLRGTPLTAVGLDSLSAIHLSRAIERELGERIPISVVLRSPSVARLATALSSLEQAPSPSKILGSLIPETISQDIQQRYEKAGVVVEDVLPCTPLQQGMLAASSRDSSYLNHILLRLHQHPDEMKAAWTTMTAKHSIFRTSFATTQDAKHPVVQVVLHNSPVPWEEYQITSDALDHTISQHISTVARMTAIDPPVSLALITCSDTHYLSFVCHHALYDGVAIDRMFFEVEQLLAGKSLADKPSYELFLRESSVLPDNTDEFWKMTLTGYKPRSLRPLKAPPSEPVVLSSAVDIPLINLKAKLRESKSSLLSLCQASWAACLSLLLPSRDVCFGAVLSGRTLRIDHIDELVAPCFNTVPIRMDLASAKHNRDLLDAFQQLNPEILEHQFTPLRHILSLLDRADKSVRLFDSLLILQHPQRDLDQSVWSLERDEGAMDIPLVCEITPEPAQDRLMVKLHSQSFYTLDVLEVVFALFQFIVRQMLEYPISSVPTASSIPEELNSRLSSLPFAENTQSNASLEEHDGTKDWSEEELVIRDVFAQLSSVPNDRIHRHSTTYQLGLDSINAVQVAMMLRDKGFDIKASDVMERPTCEKLALLLTTGEAPKDLAEVSQEDNLQQLLHHQLQSLNIDESQLACVLACTSLQAALLAQSAVGQKHAYLNFMHFEVSDEVDLSALLAAWSTVQAQHAMLRTGFIATDTDDTPFAMVQYSLADVEAVQSCDQRFNLEEWRTAVRQAVFAQLHHPPWRVMCVTSSDTITMHLAMHHALFDATSLQLVLRDVATVLRGKTLVTPVDIRPCIREIRSQSSVNNEDANTFWRSKVQSAVAQPFPVMTPLRVPNRRTLVESFTTADIFLVSESRDHASYPPHVILQAAWARVLAAYLGENTVTFGVVLSGRSSAATQAAVFPCINTLPVVAETSVSNKTLLDQLLAYSVEIYKHQYTPLARIQQFALQQDRLFDTLLVYQKLHNDVDAAMPWRLTDDEASIDYPVSIEVQPKEGQLEYRITFFDDVLPSGQAQILLQQLSAMVSDMVDHPLDDATPFNLLDSSLVSAVPARTDEFISPVSLVHEFVELQAGQIPDRIALHFVDSIQQGQVSGRTWTYKELDDNGNRVAHLLVPHVKTGDTVAVHFAKCPEAFFSILGILKAGCNFVALDPDAPLSRKTFILEDARAAVLLTDNDGQTKLELPAGLPAIIVDEQTLLSQPSDPVVLEQAPTPSSVCYCLYTSGTTGLPKGCEITHENVVQCMLAFQEIFAGHWSPDSRWLQFASLHFDVSVLEQYWTWSVGITMVSASRDLILEDLAGTISLLGITHIDLTPSLARLLHPSEVPKLCKGVFITGGESLTQEILDVWGPEAVIYNFYGPTEATIGVTVFPRVPSLGRPSNIGRPFSNVGLYILTPDTEDLVLRGGIGELCVSGKLVGKGYLGRDDLTEQRFPTLKMSGERVYRTGDMVRLLHDGCIDFLGRIDDQVKLRGQRLEIGEINHTIRSDVPEVTHVATVVVHSGEDQAKSFLVSFVVTGEHRANGALPHVVVGRESASLAQTVQKACRAKLPGYMVPTYVLQLPFIPLSSNNKAELKQLRAIFASLSREDLLASSASTSSEELTGAGKIIATVLSSLCHVDLTTISSSSSIFELGIDSISVLRFARLLKKEGLAQATPSVILKHPRIADLVSALEPRKEHTAVQNSGGLSAACQAVKAFHHRFAGDVCRQLGVPLEKVEYIAPCSPIQQGMVSRSAVDGAYFNVFRYTLANHVSVSKLREAWEQLVAESSILRTRFVLTPDGHAQVALKTADLLWDVIEAATDENIEQNLEQRYLTWVERNQENIVKPLELLVACDEHAGSVQLVIHIFHGLYDANSFALMAERIAELYHGLQVTSSGIKSQGSYLEALEHGPLQDFSFSKSFWIDHLKLSPRQTIAGGNEFTEATSITRELDFTPLEALRVSLGVTHQAVVQAAWASVLATHLALDPTIGIIVSGRSVELDDAENIMGPMFNTIPFYARLDGDKNQDATTWAALLEKCHTFNSTTLPFQHVALRDVQKWCSHGQPLFDTLFSFQREAPQTRQDDLWTQVESNTVADFPLALEATLTPKNQLKLLIVAQKAVAERQGLDKLVDGLVGALQAMAKSPNDLAVGTQRLSNGTRHKDQELHAQVASHVNGYVDTFQWTPSASALREELANIAGVAPESVSETSSLLELGLDSIDAIKLGARLKRRGIFLTTSQLMKGQSVASLAQQAETKAETSAETSQSHVALLSSKLTDSLTAKGRQLEQYSRILPTTPLQDSMVAEMIESGFQNYFNHDILAVAPSVDISRLLGAWKEVIQRSPILRTVFLPVEDLAIDMAYCQAVKEDEFQVEELTLQDEAKLESVMSSAADRARQEGGKSELLQLKLVTTPQGRYLVLSIAHALYDGWSLGMLHRDVRAAYHGRFVERASFEPLLDRALGSVTLEAEHFWREYLEGATPTQLSRIADGSFTPHQSEAPSAVSLDEAKSFCRQHAISLQVLGQACWCALLATKARALDVTFGVILLGRETEEEKQVLFPAMNTVPFRSVLHGTVASWLKYMQEAMLSIRQYQHFPLRKAQRFAGSAGPLFNTLFIQQIAQDMTAGDQPLWTSTGGAAAIDYPVSVEMEVGETSLTWRVACEDAYISATGAQALPGELDDILRFIIASPGADLLAFVGADVSICGLPSFSIAATTPTAETIRTENESNWSNNERTIVDVLSEVSGTPGSSIQRNHTIYHVGLDSISAIKASTLLRQRGIRLTPRDMARASCIAEMATLAQTLNGDTNHKSQATLSNATPEVLVVDWPKIVSSTIPSSYPGMAQIKVETVLPATSMQVHMLAVWLNTNGGVFFPVFRYRFTTEPNMARVIASWNTLVAEQPLLRTIFIPTGSADLPFVQAVVEPVTYQASSLPTEASSTPFVQMSVSRDDAGHWVFSLRLHHALYDGVSLPMLTARFCQLLGSQRGASLLSPSRAWQDQCMASYALTTRDARREFWTRYLAGVSSTMFPRKTKTQTTSPPSRTSCIRPYTIDVPALTSICARHGISIQSLFLALYAHHLRRTAPTNSDADSTVLFGVYLANRTSHSNDNEADIIHPTLRLVPLKVHLPGHQNILVVAQQVQADLAQISEPENVDVGLWEIERWTGLVVHSFVNFLRLPDQEDSVDSSAELVPVHDAGGGEPCGIDKSLRDVLSVSADVMKAYPESVDVEISVHGNCATLGVFAVQDILNEDEAEEMTKDLATQFDNIARGEHV